MNQSDSLIKEKVLRIEHASTDAHEKAKSELFKLDLTFDHRTDMRFVVAALTMGPVRCTPNLLYENQRVAGLLVWRGNTPYIYYEQYDSLVRQRFSLCHELGHYCLHPHGANDSYGGEIAQQDEESDVASDMTMTFLAREWEANMFAAAFLMPRQELVADIVRFGRSAGFLAQRYGVSESTARQRIKMLERS